MGISERREREKNERRRAILNCTRELVLSQGVEHVSMEDIARKAELSKATVYLYFSNKEELLNEICEESAKKFCERLMIFSKTDLKGMEALKLFWRGYVEIFGSYNEMIVIFKVRNYLNSWMTVVSMESQNRSIHVDTIISSIKNIIDECKTEGIFAPDLDSTAATRLLLSTFSIIIEQASHLPAEAKETPAFNEEVIKTFQIIIRGFAREGLEHSLLDIKKFM